jgi:hypothetical protein
MGVDDAIVPPTPTRDVMSGGRRVGGGDAGLETAGLWGEPMDLTKGMLEVDAALSLRSGGDASWFDVFAVVELTDPVRDRRMAGAAGEAELAVLSCRFNAI